MINKHGTGCDILDGAGISQGQQLAGADVCLQCPYDSCVLDRNNPNPEILSEEECTLTEITVQCMRCRSLETLTLFNGVLIAGRYRQIGDKIYHKTPPHMKGHTCGVCKVYEGDR